MKAKLDLDLEQWNRDVQTFLTETVGELNGIVCELTGKEVSQSDTTERTPPKEIPSQSFEPTESGSSSSRFSALKEMLGRQMSKPTGGMSDE